MALTTIAWLKGRESKNGLAGKLAMEFVKRGLATVASGQTAITVTDTTIAADDEIMATVMTKGTNACYVVGTAISAATSFTITVNTDPGSGGAVIAYQIRKAS